ncbi:MAG: signal peptide peptidase SppA [Leptospirillia bacterium]
METPPGKALKVGFVLFVLLSAVVFAASYLGVHISPAMTGDRVALVRVEGPILDTRNAVEIIRKYKKNTQVKALVLRVDSPGGGVVASQEMHDAVIGFKTTGKPVVTSMGTVAASGGYYVATPSDLIMANPGTLTGSIGVIMTMANVEELMRKVGVHNVTIKAGKNKDLGSPFREMTDAENALLQSVMDDIHDQFIDAVATGRGRTEDEIRPLADGRIFTGQQALAVGLVDELGDLDSAILRAGELAGIKGRPKVLEYKPPRWEQIFGEARNMLPWWMQPGSDFAGMRAMYMMTPY